MKQLLPYKEVVIAMSAALTMPRLPSVKKKDSIHTTLLEEAFVMAEKLANHMSAGRSGLIDYTLRVNTLIAFFRDAERDLAYVLWHRSPSQGINKSAFPGKPPTVHFTIWNENKAWWERQRRFISAKEGNRSVRDNRILNDLFIEGVPLLLAEKG